MHKDAIKKIVAESLNAPSGSNSQPWKFKIDEDFLEIFAFPEYDHPILNYKNRGTWVAHGALIENISISAHVSGYDTQINIFPNWPNTNISAKIHFNPTAAKKDISVETIKNRCTNRKSYEDKTLSVIQKNDLIAILNEQQKQRVILTEDKKKIDELCKLLCINEVVILENKKLHELFFKEIVWEEKLARAGEKGLSLSTMELAKPKQQALRLVKNWAVINFLNKFGFAKAIAKDNAKNFAKTPLMGIILATDDERSFIEAGRTMERLWLKSTEMKLSFQLIAGVMFFWQSLKDATIKTMLEQSGHVSLLEKTYTDIKTIFNNPSDIVALAFRVGFSDGPSSLSYKKSLEELIK